MLQKKKYQNYLIKNRNMKITVKILFSVLAFFGMMIIFSILASIGNEKSAFIRLIPGFFFVISLIFIWRNNTKVNSTEIK